MSLSLTRIADRFIQSSYDGEVTEAEREKARELVQRWYDAADSKIKTDDKTSLYKDTKEFVDLTKQSGATKVKGIANAILQAFEKHGVGEFEKLAMWVSQNTGFESELEVKSGAYPSLHYLFSLAAEARDSEEALKPEMIGVGDQICELASLAYIDSAALNYIKLNKRDLSFLHPDVKPEVFSRLSLKELLEIREISIPLQKDAINELVRRLIKKEITFKDLGLTKYVRIFELLVENCSDVNSMVLSTVPLKELLKLRISDNPRKIKIINDELARRFNIKEFDFVDLGDEFRCRGKEINIQKIFEYFGESCLNITRLDLSYVKNNDFSLLVHFPNLKILNLSHIVIFQIMISHICFNVKKLKDLSLNFMRKE